MGRFCAYREVMNLPILGLTLLECKNQDSAALPHIAKESGILDAGFLRLAFETICRSGRTGAGASAGVTEIHEAFRGGSVGSGKIV
jgi:hypothetical protein